MAGSVDPEADLRAWLGILERVTQTARWEVRDLLARRDRDTAADLLRGRSGELATSAEGVDQLLSVALDRAAAALARGSRDPCPDLADFAQPQRLPAADCDEIRLRAGAIEARLEGRREGSGLPCARDEAAADARLWADARIPADLELRAAMLARVRVREARDAAVASRRGSIAGWLRRFGRDAR